MSLKSKFKLNSELMDNGVWFVLSHADSLNKDGTAPSFKLRYADFAYNIKYAAAIRSGFNKASKVDFEKENLDLADFENLNEAKVVQRKAFVNFILCDWKNFEPNDDGVKIDYSEENARLIFADGQDWDFLREELLTKCSEKNSFDEKEDEESEKN